MKARKKFLAGILTVLLCVACLSAAAFAADSLPPADGNGVITLTEDVTISSGFPTSGTIDLNGYTLTYTGKTSVTVAGTDALTITDNSGTGTGTLVLDPGITNSTCYLVAEGSVTLSNITVTSTGSVVYAKGDGTDASPSKVVIDNCDVTTSGVYCVGTNASPNGSGGALYSGVDITIRNSTVTATASDGDDCMVMINVEGTLTIENSTITGDRQAVVVRAGEATITDSELVVTGNYTGASYESEQWGSGNEFPSAALMVGSLNGTYYGDASVEVTNTTIESQNDTNSSAVYVESNDSSKTTDPSDYKGSVSLTGSETVVSGKVTTGQDTDESSTIAVTGGTYDTDVSDYVDSTVTAVSITDGTTTTYSYGKSVATAIESAEIGSTVTVTQGSVDFDTLDVADKITVTVKNDATATVNGTSLTSESGPATTHNYVATVLKAGDCVNKTNGIVKYTCADCEEKYYAVLSWEDCHEVGEVEDLVEATCVSDGKLIYSCTLCGAEVDEIIPATGEHDYVYVVEQDSCTENAYAGRKCSVCGQEDPDELMTKVEDSAKEAHTPGEAVIVAATCTENAKSVTYCTVCGCVISSDDLYEASKEAGAEDKSLQATRHDYSAPVYSGDGETSHTHTITCANCGYTVVFDCEFDKEVTKATCGSYETTVYTCKACGYSYTVVDEKAGYDENNHNTDETGTYTVLKAATCTTNGIAKWTCDCGKNSTYVVIAAEHTYEVTEQTVTCEDDGYITYTCSVCGDSYTEDKIEKSDDYHVWVETGRATHECSGTVVTYQCSVCGETKTETLVEGTGKHTYGDEEIISDATCTEGTVIGQVCTVCGGVKITETMDNANGHVAGETETIPATCTENAQFVTYCAVCGVVIDEYTEDLYAASVEAGAKDKSLQATGHTYETYTDDSGKEVTVYTDNGDGTHTLECTVCHKKTIAEHEYEITKETAANCGSVSETVKTCKYCGNVVTEYGNDIDATNHDKHVEIILKAATCTSNGIKKVSCECGQGYTYEVIEAGHTWDEGVTTATCKDDGEITYTCTICGETKTEADAKSDEYHNYELVGTTSYECSGTVEHYACSICGATYDVTVKEGTGEHDWVEDQIISEATCTTAAKVGTVCSICGEVKDVVSVGSILGHTAGEAEESPATCTENAQSVIKCTVCGEVLETVDLYEVSVALGEPDESLKATGHDYGEATINEDGTHTQVCSNCGDEKTEAHVYQATGTTAATCTTGPVTTYTCSVCGNSYTAETGDNVENAHSYVVEPIKEATCTTNGIGKLVCEYCGATNGYAIIPASHDYGEEITGMDENGNAVVFRICSVCGDVNIVFMEDETAEPEHIYYFVDTDATCTEDAYTTMYCVYHEDEEDVTVDGGTATGHTFDADSAEWAWAEDYSTATVTLTCTVCGDTQELEADVDATVISEATCTQEGETYYVAIATDEAGNLYVDEKTVTTEKTEHSYISEVVTEATCVSEGEVVYICEICGDSYSEIIPATGEHTYKNGVCTVCGAVDPDYVAPHEHVYTSAVTKEATCTEEGEITYTCECGDSYTEVIPATGHNYVDGVCTVCGAEDPDYVAPHEHVYTSAVTKEATCTEEGEITYTCECGDSYTEVIPATGHNYVDGVCTVCGAEDPDYVAPHEHVYTSAVTKEATCTEEGEITYTCECGDSYTEVIPATGHSYKLSYDAETDSYAWICEICGAARG